MSGSGGLFTAAWCTSRRARETGVTKKQWGFQLLRIFIKVTTHCFNDRHNQYITKQTIKQRQQNKLFKKYRCYLKNIIIYNDIYPESHSLEEEDNIYITLHILQKQYEQCGSMHPESYSLKEEDNIQNYIQALKTCHSAKIVLVRQCTSKHIQFIKGR